ncbi:MAG: hydantoinase B/oxoprolinase family protein, partial [Nitrososphaerales archaeon]
PWALAGGQEPDPTAMIFFVGTPQEKKVGTYRSKVKKGDRCRLLSAGGGGYGDPRDRDPHLVREDLIDGYVTEHAAKTIYQQTIVLER